MKNLTSELRILQSTWGISIDITASDDPLTIFDLSENKGQYDLKKIDEKLYIGTNRKYSFRFKSDYLYDAIKNSAMMLQNIITEPTVFLIEKISFGNSDFQEEGLYSAMLLWIKHRYNLQIELPKVKFDNK